ncbi:hypothetical protein [Luedemannella helvata]|uniref:Uncharacterized protein n=1 Tax=Luedemannella helvata TaxID=349315 RepID=A0ABN2KAM3_9ACTN
MIFKHDTRSDAEVRDEELRDGDRRVVDGDVVDEYDRDGRPEDPTTADTIVTDHDGRLADTDGRVTQPDGHEVTDTDERVDDPDGHLVHDPDDDVDETTDDDTPDAPGPDGPDAATTFDNAADDDDDTVDEPTDVTDDDLDDDVDDDLADERDARAAADAPFTPDGHVDADPDAQPAGAYDTVPATGDGPVPVDEPAAAAPVDTPAELVPGAVTSEPAFAGWQDQDGQAFRDRWRDVQLRFVDDPRGAAAEAGTLVGEAVDAFTAALARQRQELDAWQSTEGDDTEIFRVAVRRYRDLLDKILAG